MTLRLSLSALAMAALAAPAIAEDINVYSHRQPELIQPLVDAFTAETGINVNVAFVDKGMAERLVAEGARSPADLVLTVDIARLMQVVQADVIQSVQSPVLEANIPAALRDPTDMWFGLTARARVVYASRDRVKPGEITTYEDLADPRWKGRICTRSGTSDYKAIAAGECDIAVGNTYYIGQMMDDPEQRPAAEAVRIDFPVFEGDGTHLNISGIAMTKAAPNKAAALRFMEWLSGDAAQKIYAETNHEFPVKPGVLRSALVQSWGDFTPDSKSLTEIAAMRPAALRIMEEVDFDG
jgi:iron(III) transport system substrate-binding protein